MKFVLFFPGTFLRSLGFADNFQWSFFKIKSRCDDEVLPVLFKHFSFEQHHLLNRINDDNSKFVFVKALFVFNPAQGFF